MVHHLPVAPAPTPHLRVKAVVRHVCLASGSGADSASVSRTVVGLLAAALPGYKLGRKKGRHKEESSLVGAEGVIVEEQNGEAAVAKVRHRKLPWNQ